MTDIHQNEPLLKDNPNYLSLFPVEYPDIYEFGEIADKTFWVAQEIAWNTSSLEGLTPDEQHFIKNILSFFAQSDNIVNENLCENFIREVQVPELKYFYEMQMAIEAVHAKTYNLLIEELVEDQEEKITLFRALQHNPIVAKKAEWALKWIESPSFAERLVAFVAVEGVFFSGSFASIFYLKERQKTSNGRIQLESLIGANNKIAADEDLHCQMAIHLLNNHIVNRPTEERIKEIILSALEIEEQFICETLPVALIGMNNNMMRTYVRYVADQLLTQLGCSPIFNVENPFEFMNNIALHKTVQTNFFERRATQYQKADLSDLSDAAFDGDLDF